MHRLTKSGQRIHRIFLLNLSRCASNSKKAILDITGVPHLTTFAAIRPLNEAITTLVSSNNIPRELLLDSLKAEEDCHLARSLLVFTAAVHGHRGPRTSYTDDVTQNLPTLEALYVEGMCLP